MIKKNNMNKEKNLNSKYILENQESFNLKHIFECGQCFRWNYDKINNRYLGVVSGNVVTVKEDENKYIFKSTMQTDKKLQDFVIEYFNLALKYNEIKTDLLKLNSIDILGLENKEGDKILKHNIALKEAIDYGYGIRILKQELWETIVSYIISANNNIPRIKKIIETMAERYGKPIVFEDETYYSFPTADELSLASIEDLRACGLGYRDKSIFDLVEMFLSEKNYNLDETKNIKELKDKLLQIKGVGPKVADCILLFGLNKYEVFPVDVWVRRVMNDIYFNKKDEKKVTSKEIINFANKRYGLYSGIAQQYLFYWKRETNETK